MQFLQEIFAPHPDLIPFMQRAVGYALTGDTREECLFLLHGGGRNGKGTFIRTLMSMLGDYAGAADFSTFISTRADEGRPRDDIADMRGKLSTGLYTPEATTWVKIKNLNYFADGRTAEILSVRVGPYPFG
jgi:putative DNA primase/helicase